LERGVVFERAADAADIRAADEYFSDLSKE